MLRSYRNPNPTEPGDVWRVDVWADRKVRYFDRGSPSSADLRPDPWVLYRHDVPSLSDEEWIADPWADVRPPRD